MSLAKRHALVTGSTSGIGLAIARALAREGADVASTGSATRRRSRPSGPGSRRSSASRRSTTGRTCRRERDRGDDRRRPGKMGSLDILVNNAGIQHVAPIEEFPPEKWDAIIAINLTAAFHAIRAAVPGMKAQKWGRIINTASAHSLVASPFKSAYVSAKHGLAGLTKTVALELATFGVTANCISPGLRLDPAGRAPGSRHDEGPRHDARAGIERRDPRRPADEAIRHRRSGGCARRLSVLGRGGGITGANLSIDGGWTAA